MNARSIVFMLMVSTAAAPAATAMTQAAPAPVQVAPAPRAAAPQAQPATPAATPAQPQPQAAAPVAAPVELPPPAWPPMAAQELLGFIGSIGREGLDPRDYEPEKLAAAINSGNPLVLAQVATDTFKKVASDLALGHVRGSARHQWFIVDKDLEGDRLNQLLMQAVTTQRVTDNLRSLLPTHPQYGALRHALSVAKPTDTAAINKIRLNMDRWRWLPRDLGQKYIIVNVPAFHATLVENGATRWKNRAIAGATKTPTPQISALATGVILNPWWEVPKSIAPEVQGKPGYVAVRGKDGKVQRWRQPPGPNNALGQMKFVMPNAQAIYLHDTNARSRFNSQVRALSHGCVRTQHIHDLAAELGSDDGGIWTREKIDETLATKKTVEAKFVKPVPVYIVYFSTAALVDGSLVQYSDLYKKDDRVMAALNDSGASAKAAATKTAAK